MTRKQVTRIETPDNDWPTKFTIKCRLREIALERGCTTITDLLAPTGASYPTLIRLWNGETKGIDFDTMLRLAMGLRCSINDLFEIDINEKSAPPTP